MPEDYSFIHDALLYIVSLIGAIGTLETLEYKFNIPFEYSIPAVLLAFSIFGVIWAIIEWRRNKRF